jgi:adenylate cyclase
MDRPSKQTIILSLKAKWPQVLILLALVVLFAGNAVGIIDFSGSGSAPWFTFKPGIISSPGSGFWLSSIMTSAELICLIVSGILLAVFLPFLKPVTASLLVLFSAIPPIALGVSIPVRNTIIPMEYSLLIILMLFGFNVLISYFSETHARQKMLAAFGQFIPPEVVNEITKRPELLSLDGESKYLTIFFCDLVDFTGISEQLNPKQLVQLLNEYFNSMTGILYHHGGTIDKYIGDSIMAFWGAPVPQEDHAERAILATFEMQTESDRLSKEFIKRGWPGPAMGIGINTGRVSVGNMGSKYRLAYTVIGDAVNLAARLQSMTRIYKVSTIVGEKTAKAVDSIVFRELDTVLAKGKLKETRIYQPLCKKDALTDEQTTMLEQHHKGLTCYYDKDYTSAVAIFSELLSSNDDKYYEYMISKISQQQGKT